MRAQKYGGGAGGDLIWIRAELTFSEWKWSVGHEIKKQNIKKTLDKNNTSIPSTQ